MWEFTGPKDSTRTNTNELSREEFDTRIGVITNIVGEDTPVLAARPFASDFPLTEVIIRCFALFFVVEIISSSYSSFL